MDSAVTTPSASEGAAGRVARRSAPALRRWRMLRQLVAPLLVVAVVAVLAAVNLSVRHQTAASLSRLTAVRAELHHAGQELARARAALAAVQGEATAVQSSLRGATAQLRGVQAQLSQARVSAFLGGADLSAVESCLGGVEVALNELGLGNDAAAVSSLDPVAASCHTALGG